MRTRKSPKNQERLFKALGAEGQRAGTVKAPLSAAEQVVRIEAMLAAGPHPRGARKALEARLAKAKARVAAEEALAAERGDE